ncbi:MAG: hypothetical protein PF495_07335 [Spirochaetales bacterium]|nr:hypothetical protein [Spirochaetales bacterium]
MRIKGKKQTFLILTAACLGIMSTGCTTRLVDFTAISTKNVDWSRAASYQRAKGRVTGKDTTHILLFIPTGVPNMKEAIDRAIESVPGGVALVDGVVYSKWFWLLYGQSSYVIEGSVLIDPALAQSGEKQEFMIAYLDKNGNVGDFSDISQDQYDTLKQACSDEQILN